MQELMVFTAPWCGACHVLLPKLEELMTEFPDILFTKINVQEKGDEAVSYGIRSLPTVLLVSENEVVFRWTGTVPIDKIKRALENYGSADRSSGI